MKETRKLAAVMFTDIAGYSALPGGRAEDIHAVSEEWRAPVIFGRNACYQYQLAI